MFDIGRDHQSQSASTRNIRPPFRLSFALFQKQPTFWQLDKAAPVIIRMLLERHLATQSGPIAKTFQILALILRLLFQQRQQQQQLVYYLLIVHRLANCRTTDSRCRQIKCLRQNRETEIKRGFEKEEIEKRNWTFKRW